MADLHPEKYPSGKLIWLGAAAFLVLLVAMCSREDPTPDRRMAEKSECERPMDSIECLEAHNLQRRRERMVEQMQDEGLIE